VKVSSSWCYLYHAIDRDGNLLETMLSEKRDRSSARLFLRRLADVTTHKPLRLTTDQHPAYGKAIRWILGRKVLHRQSRYLNNRIEQDHGAIKQRYYPVLGFGGMESAKRFCSAFKELRQYLRIRPRLGKRVSLSKRRRVFFHASGRGGASHWWSFSRPPSGASTGHSGGRI
jgi:transposase-like protein